MKRAVDRELERAWRALHQLELLKLDALPGPNTPRDGEAAARSLLASALTEKIKQVEGRAFLLLAVLYPDADMEQISVGIQDASAGEAARQRFRPGDVGEEVGELPGARGKPFRHQA